MESIFACTSPKQPNSSFDVITFHESQSVSSKFLREHVSMKNKFTKFYLKAVNYVEEVKVIMNIPLNDDIIQFQSKYFNGI